MKLAWCADQLLARTIHDGSWRNRPERAPREAYLVIHARLAESFIFASRACRARVACFAHASGTMRDKARRGGESAIAAEAFMNNVGKSLQKMARAFDHSCQSA